MKPYSIDLRERVMAMVDGGMHINNVAEVFKVSPRVIYDWLKLRRETGALAPASGYQTGRQPKITDWEEFERFAAANKLCTSQEMALEWGKKYSITISKSVIKRALKKIGYTSKKKLSIITNLV